MSEQTKAFKRTLEGVVVSDKSEQSIVVNVLRRYKHKTYSKFINSTKKYHAHDVKNEAKIGDTVTIIESRAHSKLKKWELVNVNK